MIKLKDLLFEQQEDLQPIAVKFLQTIKQKVGSKAPRGHGGFEVAWTTTGSPEIIVLHDTPREIRHPEEYFDMNYQQRPEVEKKMQQWDDLTNIIWRTVNQFEKKYRAIEFGEAEDISGGVKKTGRPRSSSF